MLLLTYDPNVKPTVPFPTPVEPERNYSISLASPYGNPANAVKLQEKLQFITLTAFMYLFDVSGKTREQFSREAIRLGLPGLVGKS